MSTASPFVPYSEVFGLQRFREAELIHGRSEKGQPLCARVRSVEAREKSLRGLASLLQLSKEVACACLFTQVAGPCLQPWAPSSLRPPLASPGQFKLQDGSATYITAAENRATGSCKPCILHLPPRGVPCRVDAGKVELDGASYAGLPLPFSLTQLIVSVSLQLDRQRVFCTPCVLQLIDVDRYSSAGNQYTP